MPVNDWLENFGAPIKPNDLESPASALVTFVERYAANIAKFIEARRGQNSELVIFKFKTGKPQDAVYPIQSVECIGVRFIDQIPMPIVYILRDNFPDTDHQHLTHEGEPPAICIDDRTWDEARLTWTPAEFIDRILSWFCRAAYGKLHARRQPLDPVFIHSFFRFFISRKVLNTCKNLDLIAIPIQECSYRIIPIKVVEEIDKPVRTICFITYSIQPEKMRRLTSLPSSFDSLTRLLKDRGLDLLDDLRELISSLLINNSNFDWRINSVLGVILEMPIIAPDGEKHNGTDLRAFVADRIIGDIAVALGIALKAKPGEGSKTGFEKSMQSREADQDALDKINVLSAEVQYEFDRHLATQISGRESVDDRKVVMVGAGAIGSHISDCLIREGRFQWTIIDDDCLLPHNLARHTCYKNDIPHNKALLVARNLSTILGNSPSVARSIPANVMTCNSARQEIDQALVEAELIIDATASIPAERYISDHDATARRICIFFNPSGDAAVLLVEPTDRSLTLRDLEAQYLGLVIRKSSLKGHLTPPSGTYTYTGSCRAITNFIPQSHVMTLSGLISKGITKAVDYEESRIRIWSLRSSGKVKFLQPAVSLVERFESQDWTVTINQGLFRHILTMRETKLPVETGGVLMGIVDIPAKQIQLVDAAQEPPDSKASRYGFERGTSGVQEYFDHVSHQTSGQVRYVGEWHSHPPRVPARPSSTDLSQIDWLSTLFEIDNLPALMLIAADDHVNIILANQQAKKLYTEAFLFTKHTKDHAL